MGSPCPGPARRPRSPTQGVLYRVLHARLDRFLERLEADPLRTLPRFVRRELEGYLACGVPGGGFARLRCDACGREELV